MKWIALAFLGSMAACTARGSAVRVDVESASSAAFAGYKTFGFRPAETPPPPLEMSAGTFEVERRLKALVTAELERKGYTVQTGPGHPDFVMSFAAGYVEDPPYGGEPPMFDMPEKRAIVIDAFDGASEAHVWHGTGEAEVTVQTRDDHLPQASVERVLASFLARTPGGISTNGASVLQVAPATAHFQ